MQLTLKYFIRWVFAFTPYFRGKYRILSLLINFKKLNLQNKSGKFEIDFYKNRYCGDFNNWIDSVVFYLGGLEIGLTNLFFQILKKNKDIEYYIDVGANFGTLSVPFFNKNLKIFAFEPLQYSFEKLKKNFEINKLNIHDYKLYNIALGEEKYESKIYFSDTHGNIGTAEVGIKKVPKHNKTEIINVDKLDNLIKLKNKKILIKIDTEGYEEKVLKGAELLLKNNQCILYIETNNKALISNYSKNYKVKFPVFKIGKKDYFYSSKQHSHDLLIHDDKFFL